MGEPVNQQVVAAFEAATQNIWNRIGFEKGKEDLILTIIGRARDALSKTLGGKSFLFRRRRDDEILKNTTLHITICMVRMPAAEEMENLFLKLKKNFKIGMMKVSKPVVVSTMERSSFVFQVSYPPMTTISFDLRGDAAERPQDDQIKFSCEGVKSLACLKDLWVRSPIFANNIPVEILKEMVNALDVGGRKKGAIVCYLVRLLSTIGQEPGVFAGINQHVRVHIANFAQGFMNNPPLIATV